MKALTAGTGLGGLVGALVAGGGYGLAGICVILAGALGAGCWIVGNRARTLNAVALITAARTPGAAELERTAEPGGADGKTPR